jgi:hypothetical protein
MSLSSEAARLVLIVVLPVPPLPLATLMIIVWLDLTFQSRELFSGTAKDRWTSPQPGTLSF